MFEDIDPSDMEQWAILIAILLEHIVSLKKNYLIVSIIIIGREFMKQSDDVTHRNEISRFLKNNPYTQVLLHVI
ncbi:hypothetical protein DERP_008864 [Dermatophagoides pteronyssinus]|uniref:Uncharacterized protein n=1 Tax=Dermatophagoides pteronyssinus TaxID=6956 RepID=A0ABQ8JNY2_DERPT|nr:hypothetical protein DERP_008864 [Dermatophagoides pteronyssinus]